MTASAALLCLAMTVYGEARGEPLAGDLDDPTGGAVYYHREGLRLTWTAGLDGLRIGRQIFWRAAR